MKRIKRIVGLGVAGILMLTILTNAMAASTTQKNDKKITSWKMDKQDINKGKKLKPLEKGINLKIPQAKKTNLPFEKDMNSNEVKKARPEKADSIK